MKEAVEEEERGEAEADREVRHSSFFKSNGQTDRQGVFEIGSSDRGRGIIPNSNLQLEN